jgi:AcrR family transcriptional regulator
MDTKDEAMALRRAAPCLKTHMTERHTITPAIDQGDDTLPSSPACDSAKRQQIMEGARRIFLQDGFDGASVGDIVRAAGVSKGTLYAYFPSKEKLFEALIIEDRRRQAEALFTLDETDADVSRVLKKLGKTFLDMLLSLDNLDFLRIVVGASTKFPQLGRAFFQAGPCRGTNRLAAYLRLRAKEGALQVDDAELAARQFLDLCKTGVHLRMMLGDRAPPPPAEIERNLHSAVEVFLAAYGRKPPSREIVQAPLDGQV